MKHPLPILLTLALLAVMPLARSAEQDKVAPKVAPPATAATAVKRVDVEEYDKLRANKTNVILDVRTPEEFKTGHIPGAINLSLNSPGFDEKVAALDKSKTYLVNCAVGMRSARACKKMEAAGLPNLYDLAPGFDGWKKAGKPVEK